jgi:hypothetical protein
MILAIKGEKEMWKITLSINFILLAFMFVVLIQHPAFAESTYVKAGSIGKQKSAEPAAGPVYRPLEKLVGERVIFLPQRISMQHYGYQAFSGGQGQFGHPSYEEAVGRIGKITEVSDSAYSGKITIQMEDNDQIYLGSGRDSIDGIGIVSEIDDARSKYIGKTLWFKKTRIETYDEKKDELEKTDVPKKLTIDDVRKMDSEKVKLKKYSPVKVIDVVAGWYHDQPIRFILRSPAAEEGYEDVTITGTNVSDILRASFTFDKSFLLEDPRKKNKWSKKVWNAIENGNVYVGMSVDQAKMSWGEPKEINNTTTGKKRHEQWVYSSGSYLYFENGVLTAIQN